MEKRRLGRGLDALLGVDTADNGDAPGEQSRVPLDRIQRNPYQPRKTFDQDELTGLAESIRVHGVLQPVLVRPIGDHYQLIAGERRLRAAEAAGIREIPAKVVNFNDQQVLEAALVENIQRSDLNPIEKAHGFKEYLDRFGITQEQLASRLGLDRTTISNLVNLLDLPAEVQEAVRMEQISLGHAKVLKGLTDPERQIALCKDIILKGLSVRATEGVLKEEKPEARPAAARGGVEKTKHVQAIEDELRKKLAMRVEIRLRAKDKGQIVLTFESTDDFERAVERLR